MRGDFRWELNLEMGKLGTGEMRWYVLVCTQAMGHQTNRRSLVSWLSKGQNGLRNGCFISYSDCPFFWSKAHLSTLPLVSDCNVSSRPGMRTR